MTTETRPQPETRPTTETRRTSPPDPRPHRGVDPQPTTDWPPATASAPDEKEVTAMTLSALIDRQSVAMAQGSTIACREHDAELWFAETPAAVETAKALCVGCPAQVSCLAGALDRAEPWGVWGGQLLVQGAIVARKRPRGRPRKSDTVAA